MHQALATEPRLPLTAEQRRLAEDYLPLAMALARPFTAAWPKFRDEFISSACLALVEAAEAYESERNVRFATFARTRIWGALRDTKRRQVPLGFRAEVREAPHLCEMPRWPEEEGRVITARPAGPVGRELEAAEEVEAWLRKLPRKHAIACRQIYLDERPHQEVARQLGCSPSRVTFMHRQALAMLNRSRAAATRRAEHAAV